MKLEHPEPFAGRWRARWVWDRPPAIAFETMSKPVDGDPTDHVALFRRVVELDSVPASAPARIWVDGRHVLRVNGVEVARGPVRSEPRQAHYDVVDLAPHLVAGENVIAIVARRFGTPTSWWMPVPPSYSLGVGSLAFEALDRRRVGGHRPLVALGGRRGVDAGGAARRPGRPPARVVRRPGPPPRLGPPRLRRLRLGQGVRDHAGARRRGRQRPPAQRAVRHAPPARAHRVPGRCPSRGVVGRPPRPHGRRRGRRPGAVGARRRGRHRRRRARRARPSGSSSTSAAPPPAPCRCGSRGAAPGTVVDVAASEHLDRDGRIAPLGQLAGFRYVCRGGEPAEEFETLEIIGTRYLLAVVRTPDGSPAPELELAVTDRLRPRPEGAVVRVLRPAAEPGARGRPAHGRPVRARRLRRLPHPRAAGVDRRLRGAPDGRPHLQPRLVDGRLAPAAGGRAPHRRHAGHGRGVRLRRRRPDVHPRLAPALAPLGAQPPPLHGRPRPGGRAAGAGRADDALVRELPGRRRPAPRRLRLGAHRLGQRLRQRLLVDHQRPVGAGARGAGGARPLARQRGHGGVGRPPLPRG